MKKESTYTKAALALSKRYQNAVESIRKKSQKDLKFMEVKGR